MTVLSYTVLKSFLFSFVFTYCDAYYTKCISNIYLIVGVCNTKTTPKCCYYNIDMLLLQSGWTPLHGASFNGHLEIIKLLINNKADISATSNVSDYVVRSYVYNCF